MNDQERLFDIAEGLREQYKPHISGETLDAAIDEIEMLSVRIAELKFKLIVLRVTQRFLSEFVRPHGAKLPPNLEEKLAYAFERVPDLRDLS